MFSRKEATKLFAHPSFLFYKILKQAEAEVMPSSNLVEVGVGLIRCKLDEVRCNLDESSYNLDAT